MSFPRYPKYKPSGVEWLGDVPEHWTVAAPKWRMSSASGGTAIKGRCADEPNDGLFPGFSASGQDVWLEDFSFDEPGIVLSAVGARCGKAFKADGNWGVVANTHCLFPKPESDRDYLWYLTNQEDWWEKGGTAQPFVKVSETLARAWVFPPRDEQSAIAEFLDRETAKIDELVMEQRRLIELLKEKRQAVISHAVTKGLNPNVPLRASGIEWLGDVPEHWDVGPIKYSCKYESGHTPSKSNDAFWIERDCYIPWVSLNDTKTIDAGDFISDTATKISEIGMANSSAHWIDEGAVVFTRDGARVGLAAITTKPMCVSQHIIAWVCGPHVSNYFLLHVIYAMNAEIYRITAGSTIPTIGMPDVKRMKMPLPPHGEQLSIVRHLINERERFATLLAESERVIELLKERRTALISAAVTGKIDVRDIVEQAAE